MRMPVCVCVLVKAAPFFFEFYNTRHPPQAHAAKASGVKAPAAFKGPAAADGGSAAATVKPKVAARNGGSRFGGAVRKSVKQLCELIAARDPNCTCADFSSQGSFQMRVKGLNTGLLFQDEGARKRGTRMG